MILSLGKFATHCRRRIFPSGLQKWWQPAKDIDCKLTLAEVSPADGVVGDVEMWRFGDVKIVFRQYSQNIARKRFPFRARKGWQPATDIDCKLAIYNVSPDDGVGDIYRKTLR